MAVDLVGIGPIGVRLIEKISDATGVLYEPTRTVRRAKAEAKAAIVRAESDVEIADIQRRAAQRFINEQILYQANMEEIIEKASSSISDDASPETMGNDWLLNFFDKCRMVSEDEMQELWARVLTGEAEHPGNVSVRTLSTLQNLDQHTADLFRTFASICVNDHFGSVRVPTLGGHPGQDSLLKYGLTYSHLVSLREHDLISSDLITSYHTIPALGVPTTDPNVMYRAAFSYQGCYWILKPILGHTPQSGFMFEGVALTKAGSELLQAVDIEPNDVYTQDLKLYLRENGLEMVEVNDNDLQRIDLMSKDVPS